MAVITKKASKTKKVVSKKVSAKRVKSTPVKKELKIKKNEEVAEPVREKRPYNRKKDVMSSLFISNTILEQSKKVKAILKANHLQHKVRGLGDYGFSKTGGPANPVFKLDFKNSEIAKKIHDILSKKYHYDVSLEEKILSVAVFKNQTPVKTKEGKKEKKSSEKIIKLSTTSTLPISNVVDKFSEHSAAHFDNEQVIINQLREKAKRIVGLIKHKFNINPMRKDNTVGYSAGKIHQSTTTGYNIRFSSEDMARKVYAFLENEHYDVSLNNLQLTVSLVKEPKQVEQDKHEQFSGLQKIENSAKLINEALDKSRTHGLSLEEIGSRLFEHMAKNNIVIMETAQKVSIKDMIEGVKIVPVSKDEFVSIIVADALK